MSLRDEYGLAPIMRSEIGLRDNAMAGDMVFVVTPATVSTPATAALWTRTVKVQLQNAAGKLHSWFNKAIATGVSIADTSAAGTATITSTTLTFVDGEATVVVSGDAAAWNAAQTDTLTITAATVLGYTVASKTSVETFT